MQEIPKLMPQLFFPPQQSAGRNQKCLPQFSYAFLPKDDMELRRRKEDRY